MQPSTQPSERLWRFSRILPSPPSDGDDTGLNLTMCWYESIAGSTPPDLPPGWSFSHIPATSLPTTSQPTVKLRSLYDQPLRKAILTSAVGEAMTEIAAETRPALKDYAQEHGYHFIACDRPIPRPPAWMKVTMLRQY